LLTFLPKLLFLAFGISHDCLELKAYHIGGTTHQPCPNKNLKTLNIELKRQLAHPMAVTVVTPLT